MLDLRDGGVKGDEAAALGDFDGGRGDAGGGEPGGDLVDAGGRGGKELGDLLGGVVLAVLGGVDVGAALVSGVLQVGGFMSGFLL